MITFGSLFSGIGGIDLGLERAGMVCKWQVEIDPFCQKVLNKHWPDVRRYADVRECGSHNLEAVDLIAGGFPCQPHSLAGKRKGADDDRNLWPEYRRIIRELQPTWVIGENVPGIKTTILDDVLSDLEGMDYQTRTLVIPACAFGAPHPRERVFVLAYSASRGRTAWGSQPNKSHGAKGSIGTGKFSRGSTRITPDLRHTAGARLSHGRPGEMGRGAERYTEPQFERSNWWATEPRIRRVAHGVPDRVDRIRALGNAVVPQVAQWLGERIIEVSA